MFSRVEINHAIECQLNAPAGKVSVRTMLGYKASDPCAVTMTFPGEDNNGVQWVFSRELLIDGLEIPAGNGDVTICPGRADNGETTDQTLVSLSSPDGFAILSFQYDDLRAFVDESLRVIPRENESAIVQSGLDSFGRELFRLFS